MDMSERTPVARLELDAIIVDKSVLPLPVAVTTATDAVASQKRKRHELLAMAKRSGYIL
jgi:ABC-type tungstate transport system substrate-binding protein